MTKPFLVICGLSLALAVGGFVFLFAAPEPLFIYGALGLLAGAALFLSFFVFVTVKESGWKALILGFLIYFSVGAALGGISFLASKDSIQTLLPRVLIGGLIGWLVLPRFIPDEWKPRPKKPPSSPKAGFETKGNK